MVATTAPESIRQFACWLSGPNVAAAEIAAKLGFGAVVLDIEHGSFDLSALHAFVPFLRSLEFDVLGKVLDAGRGPIQQALDFGVDAVVVPHILGAEHAAEMASFAKFAPLGDRSFAGGRPTTYGPVDDLWSDHQNTETRFYPMIESDAALLEIGEILGLPAVDGVFVGPSDLSLSRGRGAYQASERDFADLRIIADAARAAGKPWILPAWTSAEKRFAVENGADQIVATMEHAALASGLSEAFAEMRSLVS